MLRRLGQPGNEGLPGGMGGLADSIMHQLLSRDVLEQPMREIGARYPAWLQQHRCAVGALQGMGQQNRLPAAAFCRSQAGAMAWRVWAERLVAQHGPTHVDGSSSVLHRFVAAHRGTRTPPCTPARFLVSLIVAAPTWQLQQQLTPSPAGATPVAGHSASRHMTAWPSVRSRLLRGHALGHQARWRQHLSAHPCAQGDAVFGRPGALHGAAPADPADLGRVRPGAQRRRTHLRAHPGHAGALSSASCVSPCCLCP